MQSAVAGGDEYLAQRRHEVDRIELSNGTLCTMSGKNRTYSSLPSVVRLAELSGLCRADFYLRIDGYVLQPHTVVESLSQEDGVTKSCDRGRDRAGNPKQYLF